MAVVIGTILGGNMIPQASSHLLKTLSITKEKQIDEVSQRMLTKNSIIFIAFAIAVGINLYRGRTIPCHCFSASATDRIGPLSLVRLLFLLALALLVASAHNARGALALLSLSGEERWSFLCLALALLGLVLAIGPLQLLLLEVASVRTAAHWRTPRPTRGPSVVSDPPLTLSAAVVPARRDPRDASGSFHD
jgi:hypothetical protein